jgi:MerR family transcriptional regulator, copper efflux regulator
MSTERQAMYIGELAKRAGATPKAIRLYESLGLLGNVMRLGAYRVYTAQHVTQVRLIKQAQAMGFKLAEVAPSMAGGKMEPNWATMAEQVDQRRADIAQEIERLRQLDVQLQEINIEIRACADMA